MSKRNEAIGTVECPMKACSERCEVFRFKERGDSEKSVANRRFAGKLYGRCPKHGRFGGDPNDAEIQEYILCNATMHGAGDRQRAPATAPASLPNTKQTTPASSPAPKASPSHSAKRSSGPSTPAIASAAKPSASSPAPAATSESSAKRSGFGFFGWEDQ